MWHYVEVSTWIMSFPWSFRIHSECLRMRECIHSQNNKCVIWMRQPPLLWEFISSFTPILLMRSLSQITSSGMRRIMHVILDRFLVVDAHVQTHNMILCNWLRARVTFKVRPYKSSFTFMYKSITGQHSSVLRYSLPPLRTKELTCTRGVFTISSPIFNY